MRTGYTFGDAWCIVRGDVLVVLDRGLDARAAIAIHEDMTPATLRDEPLALAVLEPVDGGWLLWRRRGVPAHATQPLPDRGGEAWGSDLLPESTTVAFGAVGALAEALPVGGGVVRASAVRVELVAEPALAAEDAASVAVPTREADAPASPAVHAMPVAEPEPEPEPATEVEPASTPEPEPEPTPSEPAPLPATDVEDAAAAGAAPEPAVLEPAAPEPAAVEHTHGAVPVTTDSFGPPASTPEPDAAPPDEPAPTEHPDIVGIIDSVPGYIRPAAVVEVPDLELGDHDGMTIAGDAAAAIAAAARAQVAAEAPLPSVLGPATGPVVLSTLCAAGHVNPPGATACACGQPISTGSADQRSRPEFAELVLQSGERVPLGRGVVLGRRPSSRRVEDGRVPRLVTVQSPSEDISRSHLEVRCEDWNVLAIDLASTNGTVLLRDGAAPMRLRADVPQLVAFGDHLDLGDGVVVRVERAQETR